MSTPAARQNVYPALRYDDAHAAIAFLRDAFGFVAEDVFDGPDGTVAHAQVRCGDDLVMLGSRPAAGDGRLAGPAGHAWIYVAVDDPDALCGRARAAGARIEVEPFDTDYGSRDFTSVDPEGTWWSFGTYRP